MMDARVTRFRASDAKARFSELLARAEAGETITISRHGREVARLVPAQPERSPGDRLAAWDKWKEYRAKHNITLGPGLTIRQLIEEGRT